MPGRSSIARCASLVPASGQRRSAVPAWTAVRAAWGPRARLPWSPIPPVATSGVSHASRTSTRAAAADRSRRRARRRDRGPASAPCATGASAPHAAAWIHLRGRGHRHPHLGPGRLQPRDVVRRRAAERERDDLEARVEHDGQLRGVAVVVEPRFPERDAARAARARARPRTRQSPLRRDLVQAGRVHAERAGVSARAWRMWSAKAPLPGVR